MIASRHVATHMNWIEEAADDLENTRYRSRRLEVYKKSLLEVEKFGGSQEVDEVGNWIREQIEKRNRLPGADWVKGQALRVCRSNGIEVTHGYLVR